MIKVNGNIVQISYFEDGTPHIDGLSCMTKKEEGYGIDESTIVIDWFFDNMAELFNLICIKNHLSSLFPNIPTILNIPYIPNARMDRVKTVGADVFTLGYFAQIINALNFDKVYCLDAHSDVAPGLIHKCSNLLPISQIAQVVDYIKTNDFKDIDEKDLHAAFLYPDCGSVKKYADLFNVPYAFGTKRRNWETNEIIGFKIVNKDVIKNADYILIIDDICSSGKTCEEAISEIKNIKDIPIYVYATHCENNIVNSDLIKNENLKILFTTDSILRNQHDKIGIIDIGYLNVPEKNAEEEKETND